METIELINALGYGESAHFLTPERFGDVPEHSHLFERAFRHCSVRGVYLLRDETRPGASSTPVLYVAQANSEEEADRIHRQVWNQNVVPFLLVQAPRGIRLYSGFAYGAERGGEGEREGVLQVAIALEEVAVRLAAFRASAIDDGTLWRELGETIDPERRVDQRLLDNLEALGQWLHDRGVERSAAHALIGKLVYLRYLRDRDILSDRRLEAWEVHPAEVFGRSPSVKAIRRLIELLDDWINGAIFPLPLVGQGAPAGEHIVQAAGVFLGNDVRTGQLHLDFRAYDFSQMPIETLSTIYEQFLAIEGRSRQEGAFYTPIPLVDFMLAELDGHLPLRQGMRVLDPACGSGAFLVQCYRRLIERRKREVGRRLRPTELRELLVEQIFGVDRDRDACRVAELSLILTMLDYIDPPDLQSTPSFKLPNLHGTNIYESDFFDPESTWTAAAGKETYHWIVGNPPWIEVAKSSTSEPHFLRWISENATAYPITMNQTAEAFIWEVGRYSASECVAGLLLPAMTFFKDVDSFRKSLFSRIQVLSVANFSNLRRDLFIKRLKGKTKKMEIPAAALFFRSRSALNAASTSVAVYSPLLINQDSSRPTTTRNRKKIWNLTINASEIRFVDISEMSDGSSLPWKLAMWGTGRDTGLINRIGRRFKSFKNLNKSWQLKIHEGLQLRGLKSGEEIESVPQVIGKKRLIPKKLAKLTNLHTFPGDAFELVPKEEGFVRKGRKEKPLVVCYPPHVVVSAARTFAVYSDEFLVIPPRQIGIAGPAEKSSLLKALALYLSSDFARYYEFFTAPQWGIRDGRSTLDTLKQLPVPWCEPAESDLTEWTELHQELAAVSAEENEQESGGPLFAESKSSSRLAALNRELNRKVEDLLGLSDRQRWLVHDLIHVRLHLTDGKLGNPAIRRPSGEDLERYATTLRDELDAFLANELGLVHRVTIRCGTTTGAVEVELVSRTGDHALPCMIHERDDAVTREMERLLSEQQRFTRQWIYFDRNLFLYDRNRTWIFKPAQRLWWIRSQAMEDADEIIAAALAPKGGE